MCDKCNEIKKTPCGCSEPINCGCKSKVDLLCTYYSGQHLDPLNIDSGMDGNTVIKIINDYIKNVLLQLELDPTIIKNVGNGIEVYKGLSDAFIHEFKTLLGIEGVIITEQDNTVSIKVDPEWIKNNIDLLLENIGNGQEVYKGIINEIHRFRRLRSSDNSVNIITDTDDSIDGKVSIPTIDYPVIDGINSGTGTSVYNGLNSKKIKLSSLKSNTLQIVKDEDGTININSVEKGFGYIKSYYVNNGYSPTIDSPADGSIIRPFPTFDEAINAVIGNGTRLNPQNAGARIIIQTSSSTATNPTVNTITIELQNTGLYYTGTDLYMFDTEILYPLVPKDINGEITQSIYMSIVGNGSLHRNNGIGVIRSVGAKRGTSTTINNHYTIYIRLGEKVSDEISIFENDNYPDSIWQGQQMREDGITTIGSSYNPPSDMRWTTQLNPTTPLVMAKGNSFTSFSFSLLGAGRLNISTLANIGLWVEDTMVSWNKLHLNPNPHRITVQSGTVGVPGYATDIYQPKDFPAIYAKNANFYVDSIYHTNGGTFSHHGWKTFIKVVGTFNLNGMFNYDTNYYIETFIDATQLDHEHFQINGKTGSANLNSRINYLIESPNHGKVFNLYVTNSVITGVKHINKNTGIDTRIQTTGTIASINGTPYISGINTYTDDTTALANNLLRNAVYLNATQTLTTL